MLVCARCKAENQPHAKFCCMCAQPFGTPTKLDARQDRSSRTNHSTVLLLNQELPSKCSVCEAINSPGYVYCQECGSKLNPSDPLADLPIIADSKQAPVNKNKPQSNPASAPGKGKTAIFSNFQRICPKCGNAVSDESAFCNRCGTQLSVSQTVAMSSIKNVSRSRLVLIVDGQETGEEFELQDETLIGRLDGEITFPYDDYISSRHARIIKRGNKYYLSDDSSRNGTFIMIKKEVEIVPGDTILIGRQILKFKA